ncbi:MULTISPECIES: hypothetical protein [Streptomyces]|uniref:Phosphoribosyltransferase domain-containing protein n=1 Tax=Streptomyces ramulosus TaxID=47762 RepID=A0ABW1FC02_9ACTN
MGFIVVRKAAGMFPGKKLGRETEPDHRRIRHSLRIRRASLGPADRVLFVDDWIETGNQALAVRDLVSAAGAELAGCAVVVDQMQSNSKETLGRFHALVTSEELPDA